MPSDLKLDDIWDVSDALDVASPSSPKAKRLPSVKLTRSTTLSEIPQRKGSKTQVEIDALQLDDAVAEKIRRWILGIAIVEFDLDQGPVLSAIFPPFDFSSSESSNIAFSAFPDSLQFDQGSQNHSFRIRQGEGWLYGFAHFIQRRDASSKRGYDQRSLVILTGHAYPSFYTSLSSIFGPLYETHGVPMLESACHNIAGWPSPNSTLELGFLGSVIHLSLPTTDTPQLTPAKFDPSLQILGSTTPFYPPPLDLFAASLSHLWSLWECLVLGCPLLIYAPSPRETSQAVWWLRDLLRPIPPAGDFRPYLTIHDQDFPLLVNKLPPKAGLIIGVTNPMIVRMCSHWPHVLSIGKEWRTTHKRYISKDKSLLKHLQSAASESDRLSASLVLRHHFSSRTSELLVPLSRYLTTLIPLPTSTSTSQRMSPFTPSSFLSSLKSHGTSLPFRSNSKRNEFYERWLRTPAFGMWIAEQERIVQGVLDKR